MSSLDAPLPRGWAWTTLATIADVRLGKMLSPKAMEAGLIRLPYLRNQNIRWGAIDVTDVKTMGFAAEEIARYSVAPGDLLVCEGGEPGRCAVYQGPEGAYAYQKALHRVRVSPDLAYSDFLQFCLQYYVSFDISIPRASETTIRHLPLEKIVTVPIALPPLPEQRRIVAAIEQQFTRLDVGVAALKRAQARLRRYRASVLKAAVEGELTAEWRAAHPATETGAELLRRILAERRARWEAELRAKGKDPAIARYQEPVGPDAEGLPEVPEGWCWTTVEQLGTVQLGRQRSPENRSKNYPTKYIRAANITEGGLSLTDVLEMEFLPRERDAYRLMAGDIVLSEASGSATQVGKPAVWTGAIEDCCFQNTVIRLRPLIIGWRYLLVSFLHYYWSGVFAKTASGVGINHLSAGKFARIVVPMPPLGEQNYIADEVERRLSVVTALEATIETNLKRAEGLRQSILREAFAGRLVAQDPNDESASVRLERIQAARTEASPMRRRRTASHQPELWDAQTAGS